jgi:hypothetical protein
MPRKKHNGVAETEKRAKFVKLANKRIAYTLKAMQLIGNLSNRSAYSYEPADVTKIFTALQTQLDESKARFSPRKEQRKTILEL